ncbi:MAG: anti-sigma factor antagonist [Planctomycetes bacterium]|nr:anti-sigma factor antagonist [Planctomycetota bacterium]
MPSQADLLFAKLATLNRYVTAERVEEGLRLLEGATQLGLPMTLGEVLVKKQFLTPDQGASVTRLRDYLLVRKDDLRLGELAASARMITEAQLAECLTQQESVFKKKLPYPRLADMLVERKLVTLDALESLRKQQERLQAAMVRREGEPGAAAAAAAAGLGGPSGSSGPQAGGGGAGAGTAEAHAARTGEAGVRRPATKTKSLARPAQTQTRILVIGPEELPKGLERSMSVTGFKASLRAVRLVPSNASVQTKTLVVIDADGALDGYTFPFFEEYLEEICGAGFAFLVVNCGRLSYLSSAGIGVLIGMTKEVRERHGDLRLSDVPERIKQVIDLIGSEVLRTFDSEAAAVSSFKYL